MSSVRGLYLLVKDSIRSTLYNVVATIHNVLLSGSMAQGLALLNSQLVLTNMLLLHIAERIGSTSTNPNSDLERLRKMLEKLNAKVTDLARKITEQSGVTRQLVEDILNKVTEIAERHR